MKDKKFYLLVLGIIFSIVAFIINKSFFLRLILLLLGFILIILNYIFNNKKHYFKIVLYSLVIALLFCWIDFGLTYFFKSIPIISRKIVSSEKVTSYNSFLYRLIKCDDKKYFDFGYNEKYICLNEDVPETSINDFLENPKENFKNYKGKYVHIIGKINTIKGKSILELNSYSQEESLNGYVTFDVGKKIVIEDLTINPSDYYIYDIVDVVGIVKDYHENEKETSIILKEANLIKSDIYKNYDLLVNNIDDYEKKLITNNIYYVGIHSIYYKYDDNNIYSLDYLLKDKRENIENLIDSTKEILIEENKLYELDDYNLMICKNEDLIFINKNYKKLDKLCE